MSDFEHRLSVDAVTHSGVFHGALWWAAQNFIVTGALVLLVLVLCRFLRNRPAVQHALWAIVLLKFVAPAVVFWPWSVPDLLGPNAQVVSGAPNATLATFEGRAALALQEDNVDDAAFPARETRSAGHDRSNGWTCSGLMSSFAVSLGALWLLGTVVFAVRQGRRVRRQAALVRQGTSAPSLLAEAVRDVARQLRMRPLPALVVRGIASPFVWCLGRLKLAWPEGMLGESEALARRSIIAHELAHIRRRDHWVLWIELAAGAIWWWNPLFWLVRRKLRSSAEMACDALALAAYPEERCVYAETLLELSAVSKTGAPVLVLGVGTDAPSSFERRMSMIVSERTSGKLPAWGIFAAGCLALAAAPGWSLGQGAGETRPAPGGGEGAVAVEGESDELGDEVQYFELLNRFEGDARSVDALLERLGSDIDDAQQRQNLNNHYDTLVRSLLAYSAAQGDDQESEKRVERILRLTRGEGGNLYYEDQGDRFEVPAPKSADDSPDATYFLIRKDGQWILGRAVEVRKTKAARASVKESSRRVAAREEDEVLLRDLSADLRRMEDVLAKDDSGEAPLQPAERKQLTLKKGALARLLEKMRSQQTPPTEYGGTARQYYRAMGERTKKYPHAERNPDLERLERLEKELQELKERLKVRPRGTGGLGGPGLGGPGLGGGGLGSGGGAGGGESGGHGATGGGGVRGSGARSSARGGPGSSDTGASGGTSSNGSGGGTGSTTGLGTSSGTSGSSSSSTTGTSGSGSSTGSTAGTGTGLAPAEGSSAGGAGSAEGGADGAGSSGESEAVP